MLPRLLDSGAICGLNVFTVEWHPGKDAYNSSLVSGITNPHQLERQLNRVGCPMVPQYLELDDETYFLDRLYASPTRALRQNRSLWDSLQAQQPWPEGSVCEAGAARGGKRVFRVPQLAESDSTVASPVKGFCSETTSWGPWLDEAACRSGVKGAFGFGTDVRSLESCVAKCKGCARCNYVSFSHKARDCSWFQRCPELRTTIPNAPWLEGTFLTARVRAWSTGA